MKKCLSIFVFALLNIMTNAQPMSVDAFELSITNSPRLDSLVDVLALQKDDTNKVKLLAELSWYFSLQDAKTALYYGLTGLNLSKKIKYDRGIALCTQSYAASSSASGRYAAAMQYALNALHEFEELKDQKRVGLTYFILANIYRDANNVRVAFYYAQKGIELFKAIKISPRIGFAVIGSVLVAMGSSEAKSYVQKTIDLDFEDNQGNWGWPYILMGNIYSNEGNYTEALTYYRKALTLVNENNSIRYVIDIDNSIATVYKQIGKIDSCIFYASEVFKKPINSTVEYKGEWMFPIAYYLTGLLKASDILAGAYQVLNNKDSTIKYLRINSALINTLLFNFNEINLWEFLYQEEIRKADIESKRFLYPSQIKLYALLTTGVVLLVTAILLLRNVKNKQKANKILQAQKDEIATQKLLAEESLRELQITQAQLVQREKMASLGELTAGIAHEIQNPLNFVNNFSEVNKELIEEAHQEIDKGNMLDVKMLLNDIKDNEQKISHHGKRADGIVKGMMQHSRTTSSQKELTDINALADEYLRLCYHALRAKNKSFDVTLQTDFEESIGKVNIIPQEIGRVLLNIYNNAFYSVTEKSKQYTEGYQPTVSVSTRRKNSKIEIRIRDNGNGIPQKVVNKIFQPFFTTKPTGQGTGLGLSLSYDIIKAHKGELTVQNKEGEEAVFIIELPISSAQ